MPVLGVFNQKGGVGKTTTAINLLAGIALRKLRPVGIDLDPQAYLSNVFGAHQRLPDDTLHAFFMRQRALAEIATITESGVVICPGHLELTKLDALLGKGLEVITRLRRALARPEFAHAPVVIDCGPNSGVLSMNTIFACDVLIVPVSADYLALQGAQQVERSLKALEPVLKRRLPRRYVLTRFNGRQKISMEIAGLMAMACPPDDLCATRIAEDVSLTESPTQRLDVFRRAPESRGAQDYRALVNELASAGFIP